MAVEIDGASAVSASEVEDALVTHSAPLEIRNPKPLLDIAVLGDDARRIESFYASRGYFEARVLDHRVEMVRPGAARVVFVVREGEPTFVGRVYVDGLTPDDPEADPEATERLAEFASDIEDYVKVDEGDVWTEEDYTVSIAAIERALRDEGFVFARAIGETHVRQAVRTADVRFVVVPGPLARIHSVLIDGQQDVSTERILRRVDIDTGDIAERSLLDQTERDVFDLGAFHASTVEVRRPSGGATTPDTVEELLEAARALPREVAVQVSVQERPTMDARAGVGAAVETQRGEVYVLGSFEHRNLFGGLQTRLIPAPWRRWPFSSPPFWKSICCWDCPLPTSSE